MSEKTRSYIEELDAGVKELFESDRFKSYLDFLSRFHSYSINNTIAIFLQKPDASLVASYTDWKKHNRFPRRGERGIRIIAPHIYEVEKTDGTTAQQVGFHIAYCFDISQTDGEPLPESPCQHVDVDVADGMSVLTMLSEKVAPCPVSFEEFEGSANGYYNSAENRIVVRASLSEAMRIRCLLHEIAHAWLDRKFSTERETADKESDARVDQHTREVRAEAVSYCCSKYLGLDTSSYSFGYIATWSKDKTLDELKASISAITRTADQIIKDIESCQPA